MSKLKKNSDNYAYQNSNPVTNTDTIFIEPIVKLLKDRCNLIGLVGRSGSGKSSVVRGLTSSVSDFNFLEVSFKSIDSKLDAEQTVYQNFINRFIMQLLKVHDNKSSYEYQTIKSYFRPHDKKQSSKFEKFISVYGVFVTTFLLLMLVSYSFKVFVGSFANPLFVGFALLGFMVLLIMINRMNENKHSNLDIEIDYNMETVIELINSLSKSKPVVLVIEDLDRFNTIEVFDILTDITSSVNDNVQFIVTTNGENFASVESRIKYFDGYLDVLGIDDNTILISRANECLVDDKAIDQEVLGRILPLIKDIRVFNAIYNNYLIMLSNYQKIDSDINMTSRSEIFVVSYYNTLYPTHTAVGGKLHNLINKLNDPTFLLRGLKKADKEEVAELLKSESLTSITQSHKVILDKVIKEVKSVSIDLGLDESLLAFLLLNNYLKVNYTMYLSYHNMTDEESIKVELQRQFMYLFSKVEIEGDPLTGFTYIDQNLIDSFDDYDFINKNFSNAKTISILLKDQKHKQNKDKLTYVLSNFDYNDEVNPGAYAKPNLRGELLVESSNKGIIANAFDLIYQEVSNNDELILKYLSEFLRTKEVDMSELKVIKSNINQIKTVPQYRFLILMIIYKHYLSHMSLSMWDRIYLVEEFNYNNFTPLMIELLYIHFGQVSGVYINKNLFDILEYQVINNEVDNHAKLVFIDTYINDICITKIDNEFKINDLKRFNDFVAKVYPNARLKKYVNHRMFNKNDQNMHFIFKHNLHFKLEPQYAFDYALVNYVADVTDIAHEMIYLYLNKHIDPEKMRDKKVIKFIEMYNVSNLQLSKFNGNLKKYVIENELFMLNQENFKELYKVKRMDLLISNYALTEDYIKLEVINKIGRHVELNYNDEELIAEFIDKTNYRFNDVNNLSITNIEKLAMQNRIAFAHRLVNDIKEKAKNNSQYIKIMSYLLIDAKNNDFKDLVIDPSVLENNFSKNVSLLLNSSDVDMEARLWYYQLVKRKIEFKINKNTPINLASNYLLKVNDDHKQFKKYINSVENQELLSGHIFDYYPKVYPKFFTPSYEQIKKLGLMNDIKAMSKDEILDYLPKVEGIEKELSFVLIELNLMEDITFDDDSRKSYVIDPIYAKHIDYLKLLKEAGIISKYAKAKETYRIYK